MDLVWAAALVAAIDLTAEALGWHALRFVTKPLVALLLAAAVVVRAPRVPRALGIGLCCAAAGDALLLLPGTRAFAFGMAAFAAMHVAYMIAFAHLGRGPGAVARHPWLVVPIAFAVVAVGAILDPQAGALALPLALYSALLGGMTLFAIDAAGRNGPTAAAALAGGGVAFMASDTLLAFATFAPGFPHGRPTGLIVMLLYFGAQIAIARGAIAASSS